MARARRTGDGAGRPVPSELPVAERREKATAAAMRLLSIRERSAAEIRTRLRDKGYDAETIVHVLDRLQTSGLQDDRRFAETYAESAVRAKGAAGRLVQAELRRKGVDPETAASAAARSPEEEAATARAAAERRIARLGAYPADARARRLMAFLKRRGYASDLCAAIVHDLVSRDEAD